MPLETRLEGNPAAIRACAAYLRSELCSRADDLAGVTIRQRSVLASAWEGSSGDAFGVRARALAGAADDFVAQGTATAAALEGVAVALKQAQGGLDSVRTTAAAAGLDVHGTQVLEPTAPPAAGPPLPVDATPVEVSAHENAVERAETYDRLVDAWDTAVTEAATRRDEWRIALEDAAATWRAHDTDLAGLAGELIVGGYDAGLVLQLSRTLSGEAAQQLTRARQLAAHAEAMLRDGRLVGGDVSHYYDLLKASDTAQARAAQYAALADEGGLPHGVRGGISGAGGVLAVLTTGWSIHQDLENGESTEQAVVSNVGATVAGVVAGTAAGAGVGAAVGSVVPVAGTAAGAVVGAVVGTGVGVVTSGAIDSMYASGVDSAGDVVGAFGDGVGDLVHLGEDLGHVGGDVIDAIF